MNPEALRAFCVSPRDSIRTTMQRINDNQAGIAFAVTVEMELLGTVGDGDIRRALLDDTDLDAPVAVVLDRKHLNPLYPRPVTALVGTTPQEQLRIMRERDVTRLPLLDERGVLRDIAFFERLVPGAHLGLEAMVMAGGFGTRLRPLTDSVPKPMLPVHGKPLLERIVVQLRDVGIRKIYITTHYLAQQIVDHFQDGSRFGVSIEFVHEDVPMGTGGAIGLLSRIEKPLLLVNGDILTQTNFLAMWEFHKTHDTDMTVAVRHFNIEVPYGVLECDGERVCRLREKPVYPFLINAGMYILSPSVERYIPRGRPFNMTDLLQWLVDDKRKVASFLIYEFWLDIGQHDDYLRAQEGEQD